VAALLTPIALVTGATGFIGGHLAQKLLENGWSVRVLVREPNRLAPLLRSRCDVMAGDILDENQVERAIKEANVVFHCAANVKTWDTWESYYSVNVLGVKVLMNAIAKVNSRLSRLVHLSTVDVYGFPVLPCDEMCRTTGNGFGYGETKLLGESLVRQCADRNGISYTIIRPANVIGPGSQFIMRIGHALQSGVMLTVDGGQANAGLIHVNNLVDYLIWSACAEEAHGECYNVRDNYDVTWREFLEKFRSGINGKGIIVNLPYPVAEVIARGFEAINVVSRASGEPMLHRLLVRLFGRTCGHSAEKIRKASGYVGRVGFDESIIRSCQWFLENHGSWKPFWMP
jgi:nucleoside-diphosphate-sugar epimerase